MYCTNCGKKINENNNFCPYCGIKTKNVIKDNIIKTNENGKKTNLIIFVIIRTIIEVLCVCLVLLVDFKIDYSIQLFLIFIIYIVLTIIANLVIKLEYQLRFKSNVYSIAILGALSIIIGIILCFYSGNNWPYIIIFVPMCDIFFIPIIFGSNLIVDMIMKEKL